jgi:formylmethanofuran dehydrogenase subunit E
MEYNTLPDDLKKAVDFHGHICPGLMIGYRAVKAAQKALGVESSGDEELVAVVENDSCSVDAFQALMSTTFGKGNLKWLDHGKQVFTITARKQNRAVRISYIGDKLKAQTPEGQTDREAYMQALMSAPDKDVVRVQEVDPAPPALARIEPSQPCTKCGEATQKSRLVILDGSAYCRGCATEVK